MYCTSFSTNYIWYLPFDHCKPSRYNILKEDAEENFTLHSDEKGSETVYKAMWTFMTNMYIN